MLDIDPERQLEDIRLIIKDLLKVVKVVSLYPESNPLPQNLKRSFSGKFESIIDEYGDIKLIVEKETLSYAGQVVFSDQNKEEALVSLLFDSGILTITFKSGLNVDDIYRFLEVIKTGINTPGHDYDLVNELWEVDISNISLTTTEDIALAAYDGDKIMHEINLHGRERNADNQLPPGFAQLFEELPEGDYEDGIEVSEIDFSDFDDSQPLDSNSVTNWTPGSGDSSGTPVSGQPDRHHTTAVKRRRVGSQSRTIAKPASSLSIPGADNVQLKTMEAAEAMGFSGPASNSTEPALPNTTMILNDQFKLSEEEELEVKNLLDQDTMFDPWESTAAIACEMLHQEDEMSAFYETVGIIERVLSELIKNDRLAEADHLLKYIILLKEQIKNEKPLWSERLNEAVITAGGKERLIILIDSLNRHPEIAPTALKRYLSRFGWESLGAITDMMSELNHDVHKEAVRTHLASLGGKNVQIISRGIYDKRSHVVISAIQIISTISDPQVLKHLRKVVKHDDINVRLELVRALKASPLKQTLELLVELAGDQETQVRREAVNIIVQRRGQAAFDTITNLINDEGFGSQTHEDRQALLIAYSKIGGEHAVEFLQKLALQYNPLFGKLIEQLREESFEALTHNTSDRAGRFLIKQTGSLRPSVKNLAISAIQRRREIIYGEDDDSNN